MVRRKRPELEPDNLYNPETPPAKVPEPEVPAPEPEEKKTRNRVFTKELTEEIIQVAAEIILELAPDFQASTDNLDLAEEMIVVAVEQLRRSRHRAQRWNFQQRKLDL